MARACARAPPESMTLLLIKHDAAPKLQASSFACPCPLARLPTPPAHHDYYTLRVQHQRPSCITLLSLQFQLLITSLPNIIHSTDRSPHHHERGRRPPAHRSPFTRRPRQSGQHRGRHHLGRSHSVPTAFARLLLGGCQGLAHSKLDRGADQSQGRRRPAHQGTRLLQTQGGMVHDRRPTHPFPRHHHHGPLARKDVAAPARAHPWRPLRFR